MNRQGLLRALIRESILQESVSSDEIIDQILEQVKENREFVAEVLGSDKNKRALLVAAAIAI